ncbi:tRNA 2'-phosphotransferase 1-like isoform X2 [Orbicella faveolata]|uniref:tRNA 2'-phosphotransferase 1-like isoform X2 n=1 Tax=Orbicella faveolata TaxID=48498 RepID=UPI0009E41EAF|nr:tRNA 2'-phosphotransferase 1-like isoform X2 [Orbicella faveolata]
MGWRVSQKIPTVREVTMNIYINVLQSNHNIQLSKALSYILRHGAAKEGLQMTQGFIFVDDLLRLRQFQRYSEDDVKKVVAENDKKRFALRNDPATDRLQIRANQGHTMEVDDLELEPITDHSEAPTVIHGTYRDCWEPIKTQGLSRMSRNHIHFAPGEPGEEGVISGMRSSCEVVVFIDLKKALSDGFKFYRSSNNVILCPGNEQGFLPPKYFERVVQIRPRKELLFPAT